MQHFACNYCKFSSFLGQIKFTSTLSLNGHQIRNMQFFCLSEPSVHVQLAFCKHFACDNEALNMGSAFVHLASIMCLVIVQHTFSVHMACVNPLTAVAVYFFIFTVWHRLFSHVSRFFFKVLTFPGLRIEDLLLCTVYIQNC